ncbi:MAG: MFS transporter, partial [Planctomycetota bacterium]|nr:MFS transporter [Planctomycetota bacterium]
QDFGFLASGIAAAASVLGMSAAWVAPRIGVYRVCLLGYGLFAVGLGAAALYPAGRLALVMGTFTAWGLAYLHLGNGLVVRIAPHRAGTMTNLLHGVNSFGKAIGPLFALIGTTWNAPFLAIAGLGGLLGLIGLAGKPPAAASTVHPSGDSAHAPAPEGPAREALREPLFWCCGALFIPIVAMEQMVVIWLPQYLKHPSAFGPEHGAEVALKAASLILWTELFARLAASWLLTRFSPLALLCLCVPFSAASLAGTHGGLWEGSGGLCTLLLCGIAFATPWPTFFALASRYFPRHHSLLAVLSGAATSLAIILSYSLGGYIGKNHGFAWTLTLSPVFGIMVVVGAILIHRGGEAYLARRAPAQTPQGA